MIVHDAVGDEGPWSPDRIQDLIPAEQAAAAADEGRQQLELQLRHLDRLVVAADLAAAEVHLDVAEAIRLGSVSGHPPQDGLDAGAKLAMAEGLGHVVVRAGL